MDLDFKKMMADMRNANETPSLACAGGDDHNFEFLAHADGTETYSYFHKCKNCEEVVVKRHKRTGRNKMLWAGGD